VCSSDVCAVGLSHQQERACEVAGQWVELQGTLQNFVHWVKGRLGTTPVSLLSSVLEYKHLPSRWARGGKHTCTSGQSSLPIPFTKYMYNK
jgi:hypothetical protein